MKSGRPLDVIASLTSIGAGIYLLSAQSPNVPGTTGTSWFEVIAHGIGIYFIAKGIYIARTSHLQAEASESVRQLAQIFTKKDNGTQPRQET